MKIAIFIESEHEVAQSCPTLCDPIDCSPPGSFLHGIPQAGILQWIAISFPKGYTRLPLPTKGTERKRKWTRSVVSSWTVAHQAPPSIGFSRQKDWSGLPLPSPTKCTRWLNSSTNIFVLISCLKQQRLDCLTASLVASHMKVRGKCQKKDATVLFSCISHSKRL